MHDEHRGVIAAPQAGYLDTPGSTGGLLTEFSENLDSRDFAETEASRFQVDGRSEDLFLLCSLAKEASSNCILYANYARDEDLLEATLKRQSHIATESEKSYDFSGRFYFRTAGTV